ncbi:MAG: ATP-binding cassette domain-containing protein [Lachnospiraceae bacterium]|nr:ATP-binding cassette domain-containing protein [Lachnospiraceae bacterium]
MSTVLQTYGLTKAFGSKLAVDHVDMTIEQGDIYGFIGKNGAGKTTLMRLVLSLALPTSGSYELFGAAPTAQSRRRIGSLVETPGFYKNCSAQENLTRFAGLYGTDLSEVKDVLGLIGLEGTGSKKAGKFSLGMKQRLGIGIALLNHPDFIVLDEPVNGLDPAGILEMRNLIQSLNRERGITFLISSHLLDELSKIATRFGIINNGKLVEEIRSEDLRNRDGNRTRFVVNDPQAAREALLPAAGAENITVRDHALLVQGQTGDVPRLNRLLVEAGIEVSSISHENSSLESFFMERIGR